MLKKKYWKMLGKKLENWIVTSSEEVLTPPKGRCKKNCVLKGLKRGLFFNPVPAKAGGKTGPKKKRG